MRRRWSSRSALRRRARATAEAESAHLRAELERALQRLRLAGLSGDDWSHER